jgi:S1-C subfamily serine protease
MVLFIYYYCMYRSFGLASLLLMTPLLITNVCIVNALEQFKIVAKSPSELEAITKAVTVEIKLEQKGSKGSGVIIQKQGDLYTLVTNRHVICGNSNCVRIPASEVFTLELPDGNKYKTTKNSVRLLGSSDDVIDLAIIQFRSDRNYPVVKVAELGSLKIGDEVYTAGFPFEQSGITFGTGNTVAVVNKRLTNDGDGYTIIYDAPTLPGMSGGGVFNSSGQLVAIHGRGDIYTDNTEIDSKSRVGKKTGVNRGIPVRWLVQSLAELGIDLINNQPVSTIRAASSQIPTNADEYFIAGVNKFVEPGNNAIAGKRQAIQELSKAIQLI